MACSPYKDRNRWPPSSDGLLKFNVDGAARGKPDLVKIGADLTNPEGFFISKSVGAKYPNEAAIFVIL